MVTGWKTKRLGDIAEICMCKRIFAEQTTVSGDIPFFKIGTFGKTPNAYISRSLFEKYKKEYSFPDKGDILLSAAGTLGKTVIYDGSPAYFQDSNIVWLKIDRKQITNEYLKQYYNVINWASPEGSTISRLYNGIIQATTVNLPPLSEQSAIATSLSDADNLIVSLQKLIAKKKAIKQGAMQELLTGKRRLPGFNGEWIEINLAKKSKLNARIGWQGLTKAEYLEYGFAYLVTGTDFKNGKIDWDNCCFVDKARYKRDSNIQIHEKDILITKDGTIGKIAYVSQLNSPATLNSGIFLIRPINADAYVPEFIYHIMNSFIFGEFLSKLAAGSTINHLYQKDIIGFVFRAPQDLEEQIAIAQVLSDMDAEIEKLEKKLSKYQKIKQGMMQELLTGRIRLIEAEPKQEQQVTIAGKKHNQQFDDAVMIAGIVNAFYSETFPLGRKKVQKLLYLMRRKEKADVSVFHKKAAGPYADSVRYNGGETIAEKRNYIAAQTNGKGTLFRRGAKIGKALGYIQSWGKQANIDWLTSNFQYTRVDDLELFATVDMAICDLRKVHKPISVQTIKEFIHSTKEWRKKLDRTYFSDLDIQRAINKCREFFGGQ
ncbi:restriction endonuclease subunit S [Bartonella sp. B10834G6]|uniref:restriction endonuclease subunit S n=1 Tax=Bartonella apis TaxID=1686310 RepID=UPI0018DB7785|nr:restriction endonuclease subunit S [Bartonella apis]MBH9983070.1 restriction endonuclease subunit S [Bartonella apis]